jgi:Uma2 family endonuclease
MTIATAVRPAVRLDGAVSIPAEAGTLEGFTRWVRSDRFPERCRIDFLRGTVEVDMSPEDLQTHGTLKMALAGYLDRAVTAGDLGQVFVDRTRLRTPEADLSCEPDVLFVAWEALESGRARYVRSAKDQPGRFVEVEGAADLVVEVVSDSSVEKDTEDLPPLYARAGVRELWLVDARGAEVRFQIFHLHGGRYRRSRPDAAGLQRSKVLGRRLRLLREPGRVADTWRYRVVDEQA